jgi:hypothetical protein
LFNTDLNIVVDTKQASSSLVDHGKGWMMPRATLDHLCHGIVKDGDLEDVAPEHLESYEVANLHLMSNGKSKPTLIEEDNVFDVPRFTIQEQLVFVLRVTILGMVPR